MNAKARPHGPWLIEESSVRYSSEFLELYEDRVKKPDGSPGTYATVTLKAGVAILPIGDDDAVHLTRQFRYAVGRDSVEVVSGAMEAEEDPLLAAQRELREELGLTADRWRDLGTFDLDTSIVRCPVRLFIATTLHATSVDPDPTESISRVSVPLHEAVSMVVNSDITHAPSCVLILKAACARGEAGAGSTNDGAQRLPTA